MLSDGQFVAPVVKVAGQHSERADTYLYSFGYSTQSPDGEVKDLQGKQ